MTTPPTRAGSSRLVFEDIRKAVVLLGGRGRVESATANLLSQLGDDMEAESARHGLSVATGEFWRVWDRNGVRADWTYAVALARAVVEESEDGGAGAARLEPADSVAYMLPVPGREPARITGRVTGVATDGYVTAEFPQEGALTLTVCAPAEAFIHVRTTSELPGSSNGCGKEGGP